MAEKCKASVELECWKEHVCVGCGCTFRYLMKRKQTGEGPTEKAAEEAAQECRGRASRTTWKTSLARPAA